MSGSLDSISSDGVSAFDVVDRFFFEHTEIWLGVVGEDRHLVAANQAWRDGMRLKPFEVSRFSLDNMLPEGVAERLLGSEGDRLKAGERIAFQIETSSGPRCLEAAYALRRGLRLVAILDVTRLHQDTGDLEEARRSRDLLLHDAGVGTWRFNPDEDVFQFSPELMSGYGGHAASVPRSSVESICHPGDIILERRLRERLVEEGGRAEIELRMKDLETPGWRHVRIHMRSGRRLASGRFELYGLSQTITELAKARDEARANAERLRLALNVARAGVFEIDYNAETVWFSPEFLSVASAPFDYSNVRDDVWDMVHPDDRALIPRLRRIRPSEQAEVVEVRILLEGQEKWVRIYLDLIREGDRLSHAVGLVVDIDHRKRQELALVAAQRAAEAATLAKSAFLATVSHEIRTPMNGIVGVLHLLKSDQLKPEEAQHLLDEALACSGMLSQLINDVLDFSKMEAGKLELAPETVDVEVALRGVAALVTAQVRQKGLWLKLDCPPGLAPVCIDPVRLRQCLFNLIGNAVKFTLKGGVAVRLSQPAPDRLRFEVQDTGIGIADHVRPRMFQRFEQADETTTRTFSGTGLGLAISKTLAEMMGGDIGYESEEGVGSIFWLELAAPEAVPSQSTADPTGVTLAGLRVLMVDDNATNRLVGTKILQALGADPSAEADGQSAIDALGTGRFDLILMDINMPGMDGIQATRLIRSLPAPVGDLPIVALTANVMPHHRAAYLAAGMDGVVAKPFSPASLLAEISRLCVAPGQAGNEPPQHQASSGTPSQERRAV